MNADPLHNLSPLDGRYRNKLDKLRAFFGEHSLIRHRLEVEVRWLIWLADQKGVVELKPFSESARQYLHGVVSGLDDSEAVAIKQLESKTRHDVKAAELYLRQKLCAGEAPGELAGAAPFVHATCTSEDINNLAYALMVERAGKTVLIPVIHKFIAQLRQMAQKHAGTVMAARTHGQLASPTTWGKEIAVYAQRLWSAAGRWSALLTEGKFNGAVGNYNAHSLAWPDLNWPEICRGFVESLGLRFNPCSTQIESGDCLVRWLNELTLLNTIVLDFSRDMWAYIAIDWLKARTPERDEVGSSTMPHKVNPIDFENAEGNLSLAVGTAQTLAREIPVSRWQRDLSGSTRLRNLGVVAGHSLLAWLAALEGLARIEVDAAKMASELDQHYELLGEALQTEMRRLSMPDAYETIKSLTHGRQFDRSAWERLLARLDLEKSSREKLLRLSPLDYTGRARELVAEWAEQWAEQDIKK